MTLATVMKLALRQLDEDIADIADFDTLFRHYANEGYALAQSRWLHPRDTITLMTDEKGYAVIEGLGIVRIIALLDGNGRRTAYEVTPDGTAIRTGAREAMLAAICEIRYPALEKDTDEPVMPEQAHGALVDYICYRHLLNGNAAKQNRAQMYKTQFERAMRETPGQGEGSVTRMQGLYDASAVRGGR